MSCAVLHVLAVRNAVKSHCTCLRMCHRNLSGITGGWAVVQHVTSHTELKRAAFQLGTDGRHLRSDVGVVRSVCRLLLCTAHLISGHMSPV